MKNNVLLFTCTAWVFVLMISACSQPIKRRLEGDWRSKDGANKLRITEKSFVMDDDGAEDYFLKGDTIFTSFQGNLPYTEFVVQKLDDHNLKLMGPDSVAVEYSR